MNDAQPPPWHVLLQQLQDVLEKAREAPIPAHLDALADAYQAFLLGMDIDATPEEDRLEVHCDQLLRQLALDLRQRQTGCANW
jgi:hypothetical protein